MFQRYYDGQEGACGCGNTSGDFSWQVGLLKSPQYLYPSHTRLHSSASVPVSIPPPARKPSTILLALAGAVLGAASVIA